MTSLNSKLQLALLNRKKGRNLLEKGFTLVELMIVIVIVGVLSAVALPNFLSQTAKAKSTEATSQISALNKEAAARFLQNGGADPALAAADDSAGSCDLLGGPDETVQKFDYKCNLTDSGASLTITGTGNANDTSIQNKQIQYKLTFATGVTANIPGETSPEFGGTK